MKTLFGPRRKVEIAECCDAESSNYSVALIEWKVDATGGGEEMDVLFRSSAVRAIKADITGKHRMLSSPVALLKAYDETLYWMQCRMFEESEEHFVKDSRQRWADIEGASMDAMIDEIEDSEREPEGLREVQESEDDDDDE
jgi:hypothetical protein